MTQKEIDKFLADTKVYVNSKSGEIQKKLFSLGYIWLRYGKDVANTDKPFIFIHSDHFLTYGNDMNVFIKQPFREISADGILSLELTESTYRPFKDREECWNEMLKHQPFGWIKAIESGDYYEISGVLEDTDFEHYAKRHTFADGTPFGIKED